MQGSLDQPPITLFRKRGRMAVFALISALFVATGIWTLTLPDPGFMPWLCIAVFGLCLVLFLFMLIRPGRLEIDQRGIALTTIGARRAYAWSQAANFRPTQVSLTSMIGFDFVRPDGSSSALAGVNTALSGAAAALPAGWELNDADLAQLLNNARARWFDEVAARAAGAAPVLTVYNTGERINRAIFWLGAVILLIVSYGLSFLPDSTRGAGTVIGILWILLFTRRLHDVGLAGWWQLPLIALQLGAVGLIFANMSFDLVLGIVGLLQIIAVIVLGVIPGQRETNRFGPPPGQKTAPPPTAAM